MTDKLPKFSKHQLAEVICQLKFPPILRIQTQQPAAFQDKIRKAGSTRGYPLYSPQSVAIAPPGMLINQIGQVSVLGAHEFSTEDGAYKISLTRDAITFITSSYPGWDAFLADIESILAIFVDEYQPAFYVRAGLRYRNQLSRKALGLPDDKPWAHLLNKSLLGLLAEPPFGSEDILSVTSTFNQTVIDVPGTGGKLLLQHGLVETNNEQCYVVDTDFYSEGRIDVREATGALTLLNSNSGRLFKWCITKELYAALGPEESAASSRSA